MLPRRHFSASNWQVRKETESLCLTYSGLNPIAELLIKVFWLCLLAVHELLDVEVNSHSSYVVLGLVAGEPLSDYMEDGNAEAPDVSCFVVCSSAVVGEFCYHESGPAITTGENSKLAFA